MIPASLRHLIEGLVTPSRLEELSPAEWDLLVRQARKADLLARLAANARKSGSLQRYPAQPRIHLESAWMLAQQQRHEVFQEVEHIRQALAPIGAPFVLLKGAAYALAGLTTSQGRTMSDIDILVARDVLTEVESALMKRGWTSSSTSAYDQRYYREWMHELPPMQHIHRGTSLDVHHAILPVTARSHPSSAALIAGARELGDRPGIRVLSPVDMVLHSATHLFHEGELEQGLRGLVDIDSLLREFDTMDGFWASLVPRAIELELTRPLFYAIRYAKQMLGTPIPQEVAHASGKTIGALKTRPQRILMDALYYRGLRPAHASTSDRWTPLARLALYIRGHWLRMPPGLLVVHLGRKLLQPKPAPKTTL